MIEFTVPGTPQPQGSKIGRIVGRRVTLAGGLRAVVAPSVNMEEQANKATKKEKRGRLDRWRGRVRAFAEAKMAGETPWTCHVELELEFFIARPPSHLTTKGALRSSAPKFPGAPDIDKLVRAVADAMSKVVYHDDALIAELTVRKRYALAGEGVRIKVRKVADAEGALTQLARKLKA